MGKSKSWNDLSRGQKVVISGVFAGLMFLPQMQNFYQQRNDVLGPGVNALKYFQALAFFYGINAKIDD